MSGSLAKTIWLLPTISSLFYFYPSEKSKGNAPPTEILKASQEYDFIVVGGGTAGCVLANRLSEDPSIRVLLLEAGGQEPQEAQVPSVAPYLQLTELDWHFSSEPSSTSCLAMNNNRCNLPRGKVLGGSSSINYMLYVRGNKQDYDQWEAFGNPGWNFADVLPYFKKSEDNHNLTLVGMSDYHAVGGYQKISEAPWKTPLADAFLEAGKELNYPTIDINGERQTGFMIPQGFLHNGDRYSASKAFLRPIRDRKNLEILLHVTVSKVLLDADNEAYGVEYFWKTKNYTVKASKEIILSAGAIGSPQILMLSGIGPGAQLRSLGITPRVDLPVGQQLQDHVAGGVSFIIDKAVSLKRSRLESLAALYQYSVRGSGPLATFGGVEGIGFANTKYANESKDWPDIEFHFLSGSSASDNGQYLRYTLNLKEGYWNNYLAALSNLDTYTIVVKLMRPRSRGYVDLRSKNPYDKPKIVPNYLTEAVDVLVLTEGMKIAKAIGETNAMKKLGSRMFSKPVPGCETLKIKSDKYWECFLRHLTLTIYHYSGTAKMGPYWDADAVVDPRLRVYGTSSLRVADASIFPAIPTGNTNAAVIMIAEKAADMIKEYWTNAEKPPEDAGSRSDPPPGNVEPSEIESNVASETAHKLVKRDIFGTFPEKQKHFVSGNTNESSVGGKNSEVAKLPNSILSADSVLTERIDSSDAASDSKKSSRILNVNERLLKYMKTKSIHKQFYPFHERNTKLRPSEAENKKVTDIAKGEPSNFLNNSYSESKTLNAVVRKVQDEDTVMGNSENFDSTRVNIISSTKTDGEDKSATSVVNKMTDDQTYAYKYLKASPIVTYVQSEGRSITIIPGKTEAMAEDRRATVGSMMKDNRYFIVNPRMKEQQPDNKYENLNPRFRITATRISSSDEDDGDEILEDLGPIRDDL